MKDLLAPHGKHRLGWWSIAAAFAGLLLIVFLFAQARPTQSQAFAFVNVTVVPMESDAVLRAHTVMVQDGRIVAIGPTSKIRIPDTVEQIDGTGRYLMPGLIDMHVHVRDSGELASHLRWGVTTAVQMSGTPDLLNLRQQLRGGNTIGPTLYVSGPLLDGDRPDFPAISVSLTNAEAARAEVKRQQAAGYDFIKIYNGLAPEVFRAVAEEAKRRHIAFLGHVPRKAGLEASLSLGQSLIAHSEEYFFTFFRAPRSTAIPLEEMKRYQPDYARMAEAVRLTRDAGTAVTPNLCFIEATRRMLQQQEAVFTDPESAFLAPPVLEMWKAQGPHRRPNQEQFRAREAIRDRFARRLTLALHDGRVPILLGTDAAAPGVFPGWSAHNELHLLVAAGLSPYDALAAGTKRAGEFLDRHLPEHPKIGRIKEQYRADMVLLAENPLQNIENSKAILGVMSRGRWYPLSELEQLRKRN